MRATMPTRKKIYEHWRGKVHFDSNDNTCFKCGFTSDDFTAVERCHIKSHCNGGNEDVSNLHLLCRDCHKQSEHYEDNMYWFWFNDDSINDYHFKMKLAANLYFGKLQHEDFDEVTETIKSMVKTEKDKELLKKFL